MGRAPFVAMQTDLRKEDRVDLIAELTGFNRDEVLGKLFRLWAWCTDRGLEDAPEDCDGYAVPERVIRQFLGERGVEAMLGDDCDELAMGVRRPDGLIYLRGTHETVLRLRGLRATAVAGGRSAAGAARRDGEGRFVRNQQFIQPTDQPETSQTPADGPAATQPESSREPAASSEIPQSTEEEALSRARVIPPSTEHGRERKIPAPACPEAPEGLDPLRGQVGDQPRQESAPIANTAIQVESEWQKRQRWWQFMLDADARIKASGIEPNAPPLPPTASGTNENNLLACERQLAKAGYSAADVDAKMQHIVRVAEAEAKREKHRRWFKPAVIWDPTRANRAADTTLEEASVSRDAARGSRAGPRPAGPKRFLSTDADDEPDFSKRTP